MYEIVIFVCFLVFFLIIGNILAEKYGGSRFVSAATIIIILLFVMIHLALLFGAARR